MEKEIDVMTARQKFGDILNLVHDHDDSVIIKQSNKSIAAVISIDAYQRFIRMREKDFSILDEIWAKVPDLPDSEIEADIAEAISEVRESK